MNTVTVIVIKNDEDLSIALERVAALWGSSAGTPEGDELDTLAVLIEAYESKHHPVPLPTPQAAIRFEMERRNLRNKDLEPYIGAPSRVSEVLSGKKRLTKVMIMRLHRGLNIPLESLMSGEEGTPRRLAS